MAKTTAEVIQQLKDVAFEIHQVAESQEADKRLRFQDPLRMARAISELEELKDEEIDPCVSTKIQSLVC